MSYRKIILFFGGFLMLLPLVSTAQTSDQQALTQELTQQAAKLQTQLDRLQQPTPSISPLPALSEQLKKNKKIFHRDLSFGMRNDADVSNLQQFLTGQGFYNNIISSNFFILTQEAIKKFQTVYGIKATGYFGPLSRAVANKIMATMATDTTATTQRGIIAALSLSGGSPVFPQIATTASLIATVAPVTGNTIVSLPLSLSLTLAKSSYELDEYLDGTGSIVNPNSAPVPAKFTFELYYNGARVQTFTQDLPCTNGVAPLCIPVGTTPIKPADVLKALIGLDRIPPNPDLIGSWNLVVILVSSNSGASPIRIEMPFIVTAQKSVAITVDGRSDRGPMKLLQGFLHGISSGTSFPVPQLVADLKPKFWREGDFEIYSKTSQFQPEVTFETSELYVHQVKHTQYKGDLVCQPPNAPCPPANPWENTPIWQSKHPGSLPYDEYKDSMKTLVRYSIQNHMPVGYWDWWSEPNDYGSFGTEQQMFETFKAFHDAIREVEKETGITQKILAPNVSSIDAGFSGSYDSTGISHFLDYVSQNHLRIDAIALHELDAMPPPEATLEHVSRVRQMLAQKGFCPGSNGLTCPRIYINEYSKAEHHLIPGWTVGRLSYFDQADIDGAGRSCWNARGNDRSWMDCFGGLDGLFMQDNFTTQPLYWIHRLYANMDGDTRLSSQSSALRTTAIATKNNQTKTMRILAGRYSCGKAGLWCRNTAGGQVNDIKGPSVDTTITIQHYPYAAATGVASVQVIFQLVPNPDILPSPLLAPTTLPSRTIAIAGDGSLTIPLKGFGDGDVYSIVLTLIN